MKVGIIGCGNMGQALLRGIIGKAYISKRNILVSDKDRKKAKLARLRFKVGVTDSNSELIKKCDVIVFAIKPQDVDAVLQDALLPLEGKLLISICAGLTTRRLEKRLGKVSVVRVMPNMPALLSSGISALSLGKYATARDKKVATSIFSCIGEVVEVKEQLMDAVTAISGSGPAYFFYLAQKLVEAAKELGIPGHIAQRLAIKTALGSAMLMDASGEDPQTLRKRVTSKGGTTEAAFNVLKKKAFGNILQQACYAAAKRSKQLQKEIERRDG